MELTTRQAAIIEAAVRAYVEDGQPVSSSQVSAALDTQASPATIRNEMVRLTELGFFGQPHTSAGRVPTAAAYRLVTERMLAREREQERARELAVKNPEAFARRAADRSRAAAYVATRDGVAYAGFEFVLTAPELSAEAAAREAFAHLMDALPLWTSQLRDALMASSFGIFVAEENPIHSSGHFSIVAARLPGDGIAAVIGPVRMRYDAAIRSLLS
jgi:heat-inducible transcriptional repressor